MFYVLFGFEGDVDSGLEKVMLGGLYMLVVLLVVLYYFIYYDYLIFGGFWGCRFVFVVGMFGLEFCIFDGVGGGKCYFGWFLFFVWV